MNDLTKEFGKNLRSKRMLKGKSIYRIMKEGRLHFTTVKEIESGEKDYKINSLIAYCEAVDSEIVIKDKK